jgi:hypothetical protein
MTQAISLPSADARGAADSPIGLQLRLVLPRTRLCSLGCGAGRLGLPGEVG